MTAGYTATLWQLDLSAPSAFVQVPGVTVEALAPRTIVDTARNLLVVDAPLDYPSEYASLNTFDLANLPGRSWRDKGLQPPQPVTLAWGIDRARAAIEVVGQDDYGRFQSTLTTRDALARGRQRPAPRSALRVHRDGGRARPGRALAGRPRRPLRAPGSRAATRLVRSRSRASGPVRGRPGAPREAIAPPGGGPGALSGHSAVLDSVGHRIVFFGGESDGGVLHSEAWALELDPPMHWQLLATNVAGPARAYHLAAIDPSTRRMYVIAGRSPDLDPQPGGLWQLDLAVEPAAWTRLGDEGLSSTLAALGYDRVGHRLLAVDGLNGTAFDLGAGPPYPVTTVPLSTGPGRIGIMGAFDPTRNLVLVHGGWYRYSNTGGGRPEQHARRPGVGHRSPTSGRASRRCDPRTATHCSRIHPASDRVLDAEPAVPAHGRERVSRPDAGLSACRGSPARTGPCGARASTSPRRPSRVARSGFDSPARDRPARSRSSAAPGGPAAWTALGNATEVSPRMYEYLDASAVAGESYRYRARWWSEGVEQVTAASEVIVLPGRRRRSRCARGMARSDGAGR